MLPYFFYKTRSLLSDAMPVETTWRTKCIGLQTQNDRMRRDLNLSKAREKRSREAHETYVKDQERFYSLQMQTKIQRIDELERDMTKSHNALADMFLCPITKELPVDPVLAADGKIYERAKIEEWLAKHDTSPATGEKMKDKVLTAASSVVTGAIDLLVKCNAVDEQKRQTLKTKLENEQKLKELKSKAEAGDYATMCSLAYAYRDGNFGLAKDKKEAENWFRRSAEGGHNGGMSAYGELLVNKGDLILGMHYLTRTATECDNSAYKLGRAYHYAKFGLPKDLHQAKYYLSMVGKCRVKNILASTRDEIATELRAIQDEIDGQEQFELGRAEHREKMRKMRKIGMSKNGGRNDEQKEGEDDEQEEEEDGESEDWVSEEEEEEGEDEEEEEDEEDEEDEDAEDDKTEKADSDVEDEEQEQEQEQPRLMLTHVA